MTLQFADNSNISIQHAEESYSDRMKDRGVILSIHLNTDKSVTELRDIFTTEKTSTIILIDSEGNESIITGYQEIDSIRKFYGSDYGYNTAVDLLKE